MSTYFSIRCRIHIVSIFPKRINVQSMFLCGRIQPVAECCHLYTSIQISRTMTGCMFNPYCAREALNISYYTEILKKSACISQQLKRSVMCLQLFFKTATTFTGSKVFFCFFFCIKKKWITCI